MSGRRTSGPLRAARRHSHRRFFERVFRADGHCADQGASVIKVEAPEGDTSRVVGPAKGDLSAAFITANRGKRSIALDLKHPEARTILAALVRQADVLVSNFRPGVMERLGLDRRHLQSLNPRLVQLSITGFGPDGPRAEDRAYDAVIQAVAGVSASHRDKHTGLPGLLSTTACDKLTALTAAQAVTAALFARERHEVSWTELEVVGILGRGH